MLKIGLSLFLTGLFLGAGPCLVSCGPFLVSFIAGNKKDFKSSLWIWFIFSASRILAYLILGVLIGLFSQSVIAKVYTGHAVKYIFIAGGAFVALIGILMFFDRYPEIKICEILKKNLIAKDARGIAFFGLVIGFLPCAPLLGILTYISLISKDILRAIFYCFAFGIGTLVSPLIILTVLASAISKLLGGQDRVFSVFQKICGIIILILGIQLIRNGLSF